MIRTLPLVNPRVRSRHGNQTDKSNNIGLGLRKI